MGQSASIETVNSHLNLKQIEAELRQHLNQIQDGQKKLQTLDDGSQSMTADKARVLQDMEQYHSQASTLFYHLQRKERSWLDECRHRFRWNIKEQLNWVQGLVFRKVGWRQYDSQQPDQWFINKQSKAEQDEVMHLQAFQQKLNHAASIINHAKRCAQQEDTDKWQHGWVSRPMHHLRRWYENQETNGFIHTIVLAGFPLVLPYFNWIGTWRMVQDLREVKYGVRRLLMAILAFILVAVSIIQFCGVNAAVNVNMIIWLAYALQSMLSMTYAYMFMCGKKTNKLSRLLSPGQIDWWKALRAACSGLLFLVIVTWALIPISFPSQLNWGVWAVTLLFGCIAIAVQTLAEELIYRRPLLDVRSGWQACYTALSSCLFSLGHLGSYTLVSQSQYSKLAFLSNTLLMGLGACVSTWLTGGVELAWGAHCAHNFFVVMICGDSVEGDPSQVLPILKSKTRYIDLLESTRGPLGLGYFVLRGLAYYTALFASIWFTELLAKPRFEVHKIDHAIELKAWETAEQKRPEIKLEKKTKWFGDMSSWLHRYAGLSFA